MDEYLGKAVVDGELRYGSVSSVKLFDRNTKGGCPRRWGYKYLFGKREEFSEHVEKAMEKGRQLDKELKHYLRTGDKALSALAIKGLHILEKPGPDLKLDVKIHRVDKYDERQPDGSWRFGLTRVSSVLTAAGVPFVGELDVAHERGHFRDDDGEFYEDPPETVEVGDIKFKSNAKDRNGNSTLMLATDLVRDIQMAGYGEWVARARPSTQHVRLSHLYFPAKPAGTLPTKVTRLHVIDDCRRTWEYVEGVVADMKQVARETDIEKIPGNPAACDEFAGCSHREYCSAYKRNSLDSVYGKIADDHKENAVGLLQNNPQLLQPNVRAQLDAEEAQMRAQQAQQQAQMPTPNLANAWARIESFQRGTPALGGNAALAYAQMRNIAYAGHGFAGAGQLGTIQLTEVDHIYQLGAELEAQRVQAPAPAPYQPGMVAAPTPSPAPGLEVRHTPAHVPTIQQQVARDLRRSDEMAKAEYAAQAAAQQVSFLPPDAPPSMPQLAVAQPKPAEPSQTISAAAFSGTAPLVVDVVAKEQALQAAAEKPKRGRPKQAKDAAPESAAQPAAQIAAAPQTPSAVPPTAAGAPTPVAPVATSPKYDTTGPLESGCVLVNARFAGKATKSLAGYVDYINGELARRYCVDESGKPTVQDVRCAPPKSPLAFGGWKGAVREVVKADPPAEDLYHFDTFLDDLNEAVADALRVVAEQKGWLYVRGVR